MHQKGIHQSGFAGCGLATPTMGVSQWRGQNPTTVVCSVGAASAGLWSRLEPEVVGSNPN